MATVLYTIAIILGLIIIYVIISSFRLKKAVTNLTQEEFIKGYRKAQLIDVREAKEFESGHILGARNIPFSQLRYRYKEIRPDLPVYLYCQNMTRSSRAALFLKKKATTKFISCRADLKLGQEKLKQKINFHV